MFFQQYFIRRDTYGKNEIPTNIGDHFMTNNQSLITNNQTLKGGIIGGAIGFLSGMVGIGGGIFLSPILNLMKWDTPKNIAATASFFILINSIASLVNSHSFQ